MRHYGESLRQITHERQTRDNILKKIELLEKQKVILAFEIESFEKMLKEEKHDVDTLEHITFESIINNILHNKVEKLNKEKEQLYSSQLKFEKLKDEYQRILKELEAYTKSMESFALTEDTYKQLIEEMTAVVEKNYPNEAEKLNQLMEQRYAFEIERIVLVESLKEGEELLTRLNRTQKYLLKAKDWGEHDFSGSGLVATMKKYHYLDEAQELLHQIQWGLRKFHNALEQLGWHQEKDIEKFLKVSDYWIDGVFSDYSLQSAIEKLIEYMNLILVDILSIDQVLRQSISSSQQKRDAIEGSLEQFFEKISDIR